MALVKGPLMMSSRMAEEAHEPCVERVTLVAEQLSWTHKLVTLHLYIPFQFECLVRAYLHSGLKARAGTQRERERERKPAAVPDQPPPRSTCRRSGSASSQVRLPPLRISLLPGPPAAAPDQPPPRSACRRSGSASSQVRLPPLRISLLPGPPAAAPDQPPPRSACRRSGSAPSQVRLPPLRISLLPDPPAAAPDQPPPRSACRRSGSASSQVRLPPLRISLLPGPPAAAPDQPPPRSACRRSGPNKHPVTHVESMQPRLQLSSSNFLSPVYKSNCSINIWWQAFLFCHF
ncbi:putative uncharacterized protein ENSP00000383309 [Heterodontus francisci]|uniref:putative uncharacterized protein ENSP00000383309 n=1 Tax=Heterodontus francisci TaxID=7792 RepID=UPI00355BA7A3